MKRRHTHTWRVEQDVSEPTFTRATSICDETTPGANEHDPAAQEPRQPSMSGVEGQTSQSIEEEDESIQSEPASTREKLLCTATELVWAVIKSAARRLNSSAP